MSPKSVDVFWFSKQLTWLASDCKLCLFMEDISSIINSNLLAQAVMWFVSAPGTHGSRAQGSARDLGWLYAQNTGLSDSASLLFRIPLAFSSGWSYLGSDISFFRPERWQVIGVLTVLCHTTTVSVLWLKLWNGNSPHASPSQFSSHPKSACFSFSVQNLWASFFFLFVFLSEITVVTFREVVLLTAYSTILKVETFYNIWIKMDIGGFTACLKINIYAF